MHPFALFLAAINPINMVWIAAALGLLLIGGVLSFIGLRRWLRADSDKVSQPEDFTLDQLRQMFQNKQLTQQEFDALKEHLIQKTRNLF